MANMTLSIADAKLPAFKAGFLETNPVPLGAGDVPLYTENEWIKVWAKQQLINAYRLGVQTKAVANVTVDNDIVT